MGSDISQAGDQVAREIIERAGTELGRNAALVARKLGMEENECELVLAGGMFAGKTQLLVDPLFTAARQGALRARAFASRRLR